MRNKYLYTDISKISLYTVYFLGFFAGVFLTKTFVKELKDDTQEYDYIMYQFYRKAIIGNKFRFVLYLVIGPLLLCYICSFFI